MNVKAKLVYTSEDGQQHDTRDAALSHNARWKSMQGILKALQKASPGQSVGTLHIDINNKPDVAMALRDACNKVLDTHRRYGKLKKSA